MRTIRVKEGTTNLLQGLGPGASRNQGARYMGLITVYFRIAVGIGFLSAVADRLGLWGPPATPNVSWGNFHNFLAYTAKLNPWFPASWIPTVGWVATVCEIAFGSALIIGYRTRLAAVLSGVLTLVFAISMVFGVGIHAPSITRSLRSRQAPSSWLERKDTPGLWTTGDTRHPLTLLA